MRSVARGSSLLELSMWLAAAAVLATLAYPSYLAQLQKSRRVDAMLALYQVQLAQERWRADHGSYSSAVSELGVRPPGTGYYELQITEHSAHGYTAVASAASVQAADSSCTSLRLTLSGGQAHYGSTGTATSRSCWNR